MGCGSSAQIFVSAPPEISPHHPKKHKRHSSGTFRSNFSIIILSQFLYLNLDVEHGKSCLHSHILLSNLLVIFTLCTNYRVIARTSGDITWRRGELIQNAGNSKVYQGFNLNTGQIIAIKTVHVLLLSHTSQIIASGGYQTDCSRCKGFERRNFVASRFKAPQHCSLSLRGHCPR